MDESTTTMSLTTVMFIAIATGIAIASVMYGAFRLYAWSAITIAVITTYFIINISYPLGHLMYEKESYVIALYLLFEVCVPIYLFVALIVLLFLHAREG